MSEETSNSPKPDPVAAGTKTRSPLSASGTPLVLPAAPPESGRNLALGVFLVLAAVPLAGVAFIWAPQETFVAISTTLLISLLVFLFFQLRLVSQRNGMFALLAAGLLVTLAVPVLVKIGASSSELAQWFFAFRQSQNGGASPVLSLSHERRANVPSQPGAESSVLLPVPGPVQGAPASSSKSAASPGEAAPSAQGMLPPRDAPTPQAVESKAPASIAGREKVEPDSHSSAPQKEETAAEKTTRLATEEAIRRYPGLGKVGSREHARYIEGFNEFKRLHRHEFFADNAWPLNLAELLAERHGWKRADVVSPQPPAGTGRPLATEVNRDEAARAEEKILMSAGASGIAADSSGAEPESGSIQKVFGLDLPETDPANPNHQAVLDSLREVSKKYPASAQSGSLENRVFREAVQEYERLRPDFFESPRWPLRLADLVAKREGWRRIEGPQVQSPPPQAASPEGGKAGE